MDQSNLARLDLRHSSAPADLATTVLLTDAVTSIGRLEAGEPGARLDGERISRKHACVRRESADGVVAYSLENLRGRAGVRLYEKLLQPGDRQILQHGYTFQIPGVLVSPQAPHYLVTFREDDKQTTCLAFEFCPPAIIRIFGQIIDFSPQKIALLAHLFSHKNKICYYADVIAAIWAPTPGSVEGRQSFVEQLYADHGLLLKLKDELDVLLSKVRGQIREASGGLALIETIRGEGLCLRI